MTIIYGRTGDRGWTCSGRSLLGRCESERTGAPESIDPNGTTVDRSSRDLGPWASTPVVDECAPSGTPDDQS
jgi:hypothetical protein